MMMEFPSILTPVRLLCLSTFLWASSCCDCIDIGCGPLFPELIISTQVGPQAEFQEEELQEVFLVRTTLTYERIDSAAYAFGPERFGSEIYQTFVSEGPFNLGASEEWQDFNYLLVNSAISQIDTLSNMSYTQVDRTASCENCSGLFCQSDDLIQREYQDFQVDFNGTTIMELEIPYFRK